MPSKASPHLVPRWAAAGGAVLSFPSMATSPARPDARPTGWNQLVRLSGGDLAARATLDALGELASGMACRNERTVFGELVGSNDLTVHPVHRWYFFKEAYS